MRTWDIINVVEGDPDITESRNHRTAARALVTSAVKAAFIISVAVASTTQFTVKRVEHISTPTRPISFVGFERGFPPAKRLSRVQIASDSDTQLGQSTARLAQLFETYFVQAPDEESYEDAYSFS